MSEVKEKFWAEGSMSKEDMGEVIALFRSREGLSQEEFAEAIGCSPQILKSAENGKGNHVYGTLNKVCAKYNLEAKMTIEEIETIV